MHNTSGIHAPPSQESDLYRLHYDAVTKDPFISKALGPNPKLERMKAASLRLGGQGLSTTYDNHLLIIGDAAGHIDPLTGEGIHTAIMGGKAAAETLLEARESGNFGRCSLQKYEARWIKLYGHDFALVRVRNLCYKEKMKRNTTPCIPSKAWVSSHISHFPTVQSRCRPHLPRPHPPRRLRQRDAACRRLHDVQVGRGDDQHAAQDLLFPP